MTRPADRRQRMKGRRESGGFTALPHAVMDCPRYLALSHAAKALLLDLLRQFNGRNNGDLHVSWGWMKARGWRSKTTLYAALGELIEAEFIVQTRPGGLHACGLYAVTWKPIDDCEGKLATSATTRAPGGWNGPPPDTPERQRVHWRNPKRRAKEKTHRLVQILDRRSPVSGP